MLSADSVFKLWVRASIGLLAAFVVWNYVPILIPLAVVGGALGLFALGVRKLAARVRAGRDDQRAD
jgi:hypothetical protein